jgi:autotransporter-associated beta strand protein
MRNQMKRFDGGRMVPLAGVVALVLLWGTLNGPGATRYWQGTADNNWSTPGNWLPTGPPQDGDDLFFTNKVSNNIVNDLVALSVHTMTFDLDFNLSGNALTVTGGITDYTSGGVSLENGGLTLGGDIYIAAVNSPFSVYCPINLNGFNLAVSAFNGNYLELGGMISGNGNVISARGKVLMDSISGNTFNGTLVVQGGTNYLISQNAPAVVGGLEVDSGGTVITMFDFQIAAPVLIQASGQLLLNNHQNDFSSIEMRGGLLDSGPTGVIGLSGRLQANTTNQTAQLAGTVYLILDGGLNAPEFNVNGPWTPNLDVTAQLRATSFQKTGFGMLRLFGANTFQGLATLWQGLVEADNNSAFGKADVDMEGGSLLLRGVAITNTLLVGWPSGLQPDGRYAGLLTANNTCVWSGPLLLYTNLFAFVVGDLTLSGPVSGGGGLSFWSGSAHLTGPQANTFTGTVLSQCQLLELNKPSGVQAYSGSLVVGGGNDPQDEVRWSQDYQYVQANVTLYPNAFVNLNGHHDDFYALTFNGGTVGSGAGQLGIYGPVTVNPASSSAIINGNLGLPPGASRILNVGSGSTPCDLLINAVVFGNAPYLVKQGPGTACLTAVNTFAGVTLLEQGILDISNGSALSSTPCVIFDGATLRLEGVGTVPNNFEMVGAGVGGTHGAVEVVPAGSYVLTGSILLDASTTFNVAQTALLETVGIISGTGPLVKSGAGPLYLAGSAANTFAGDTVASAGTLSLNKTAAAPGNVVVGPAFANSPATAVFATSGGMGGSVATVNANSLLNLNGYAQLLTQLNLNDGGSVLTGAGSVDFVGGGSINVGSLAPSGSHASSSIQGYLGLPANDVAVNFNVNPYAIFFPFDSRPELDVQANIWIDSVEDPRFVRTGINKSGGGRMRVSGNNTLQGATTVNAGKLQVDGTQGGFVIVNGGTLKGTGTVGPLFLNDPSATAAPGDSPGILTCGNLDRGSGTGTLQVELDGPTPGTGYSQLNVLGTVNLNGLALRATLNYASAVGDQFVIINNDGTDPVSGTLTGLPQNAKLYIGGQLFQINYAGGTGNDVVLSRLITPPPPTLTIQRVSPASVRLVWPTNNPPFSLQTATNLPANSWTPVLPPPVVSGINNVVTNSATSGQQFYRLSNP